ncbi:MAG: cysteine desulfurase IscS [marine bacterium B5-7]|nr:MAG: cysteine desulfurase IscS [marine bacterium B5-7]
MNTQNKPIYLDYAATTPVDARVAEKMSHYLTMEGVFGNPASTTHAYGWAAQQAVEQARGQVAHLVKADPNAVIFTSGATESINLALQGVMRFYHRKGNHLITLQTEHKATLDTCAFLEKQGCQITYLKTQSDGRVALADLKAAFTEQTVCVSLSHVNNEIGTIQDVSAIGELTRAQGILFHVDAAQSAGKLPIDVNAMKIDLLSLSAHKIYGPKGIGALLVRQQPRLRLMPMMYGGGHEQGYRSGTLPTHQIVGMGEACAIAATQMDADKKHLQALAEQLRDGILALGDTAINGTSEDKIATILNVRFGGVDGEGLLNALTGLAVSSGSACTSANVEPSHVLRSIGCSDAAAHQSLRFSLGRYTTAEDIEAALNQLKQALLLVR